jgi:hypothetical protein
MVMEELVEKLRDTILGIAECSEGGIVNSEAIARSVLSCIEETHELVPYPHVPTPEEVKKDIEDTTGIPDILRG